MEEKMTNEMIEDIDTVEEVEMEIYEEPEEKGVSMGTVLLVGGLAALSGIIIAKRKKIKNWFRRKQVDKLEKEGYVIFAPGDMVDENEFSQENEEPEVYESDEE